MTGVRIRSLILVLRVVGRNTMILMLCRVVRSYGGFAWPGGCVLF